METFLQSINTLIVYILAPVSQEWYLFLRIAFFALAFMMIAFIIWVSVKCTFWQLIILTDASEFLTFRPAGVRKIEKQWNKIKARTEAGLESENKLAVIEADHMFDDTLRRMGYLGEGLGERLQSLTSATISNIEEIKKAHQVRNNIVHNPDYKLSLDETREVLEIFEQGLRNLDAF